MTLNGQGHNPKIFETVKDTGLVSMGYL